MMRRKPQTEDDLLALMGGGDVEDQGDLTSYLGAQADMADTELGAPMDGSPEGEQDALAILAKTGGELPTGGEPQPQAQQPSEAIQRLEALGQQPATGPELPEPPMVQPKPAPKGKTGFDTTMDVLALFLDSMLNDGKNIPGLIGNMQQERAARAAQQPGDVDYENYKRRMQHAKDVSGLQPKGPSALDLENARLQREKFEAEQERLERKRGESLEDFEKRKAIELASKKEYFDYTDPRMLRRAAATAGRGVPGAPDDVEAQIAAIQGAFPNGVPPTIEPLLGAARNAAASGQKKRAAEILKVARGNVDDERANKRLEQTAEREQHKISQQQENEVQEYARELQKSNIPKVSGIIERLQRNIAAAKKENGGDIFVGRDEVLRRGPHVGWGQMSERARAIMQDVQLLQNADIKDTSGAAVTTQEMPRVEAGMGTGKLSGEADLERYISNVKDGVDAIRGSWRRAYPEAAKLYEQRGQEPKAQSEGSKMYNIVAPDGRSTTKQLTAAAALKLKSKGYEVTSAGR